jgi:DNA transposition AAA+ family ATPase
MVNTSTIPSDPSEVTNIGAPRNFRIPADRIKSTLEGLPEDERAVAFWFAQYCRSQDFTRTELGRVLRKPGSNDYYSADSITALFTGGRIRRNENVQPILEAIATLKKIEDARAEQTTSGFIETRLFRIIEGRCLKALARQKILFIWGESQIGKTESLKEVQRRHNHGQTIYMEVPTGGSLGNFLKALARVLGVPEVLDRAQLTERIINCFDGNMLLICDEMHRCTAARYSAAGLAVFSFLRELWNRKKCGMVLSLTNEGRDQFLHGPHAKAFQQLWRRRITPLQLPAFPPDDDAALFAEAYGLTAATDEPIAIKVSYVDDGGRTKSREHSDSPLRLQRQVLMEEGLGVWIGILQDASDMAREQRRSMSWGAVLKAHAQSLAECEILD